MKAMLKLIAERIDAASLRERVLIFLALTAGLVFVLNAVLIAPLRPAAEAQPRRMPPAIKLWATAGALLLAPGAHRA